MTEYYFDMETTGFDFDVAEIITIQWQRVDGFTGEPIGELNILKRWDYPDKENAEMEMLKAFIPNLKCRRWDLIDFCILDKRMKKYDLGEFDIRCLYDRAVIDIKPILVLMNKGSFIGYDKVLKKTNPLTNEKIPQLYREGKYAEIIQYIKDEAQDFIKVYQVFKKEMPLFRERLC